MQKVEPDCHEVYDTEWVWDGLEEPKKVLAWAVGIALLIALLILVFVLGLWGSGEARDKVHPEHWEKVRIVATHPIYTFTNGAESLSVDLTCHQRMKEVMTKLREVWRGNENSRSLRRGFVMTDEIWLRDFEPIYQECVR